jgi:hypothetical protein
VHGAENNTADIKCERLKLLVPAREARLAGCFSTKEKLFASNE